MICVDNRLIILCSGLIMNILEALFGTLGSFDVYICQPRGAHDYISQCALVVDSLKLKAKRALSSVHAKISIYSSILS